MSARKHNNKRAKLRTICDLIKGNITTADLNDEPVARPMPGIIMPGLGGFPTPYYGEPAEGYFERTGINPELFIYIAAPTTDDRPFDYSLPGILTPEESQRYETFRESDIGRERILSDRERSAKGDTN